MVTDPVQVVGDALESSRSTRLAAVGGDEVANSHQLGAVVCDQGTARVTSANGLAVDGAGADDVVANAAVGPAALFVVDDLEIDALQPVGQWAAVVGATPSASDGPPFVVVVVTVVVAGELHLVHHVPEVDVGDADQGDISVGMLDEVAVADGVGELGVGAPGGTEVNDHGSGISDAVLGSQDPVVGDDGATAPPASAEAKTHSVGSLALGGGVSVGDTTLNLGGLGQVLHEDLLVEGGGRSHGQSQDS